MKIEEVIKILQICLLKVIDLYLIRCHQIISIEWLISLHILIQIICINLTLHKINRHHTFFNKHLFSRLIQLSLSRYNYNQLNQLPINPQTMSNQQQNIQESASVQTKKQKQILMILKDKNVSQTNHNQNSLRMKMKMMISSKKIRDKSRCLSNPKYKYSQSKKILFNNLSLLKYKIHYPNFVHKFST